MFLLLDSGGNKYWENFAKGEVHFFTGRGDTSGEGTQISDILLDHPGGECQLSPQKSFLSTYQMICSLSHFILLSKLCLSVCFFQSI